MKRKQLKLDAKQVEDNMFNNGKVINYFKSYCELHDCCDVCNKKVRFICKIKRNLQNLQSKIILKEINKNGK